MDGSIAIFSAHGVSKGVQEDAARRNLKVFDATCPLVAKVHLEVSRYQDEGRECILIGEARHQEVEGTLGQHRRSDGIGGMYLVESVDDVWKFEVKNSEFLAYVTQTTLSVDDTAEIINALHKRFPKIIGPKKEDICYAAQNRQNAVKRLVDDCEVILVVGSRHSHNSARLKDVAEKHGVPAYLIDNASEIQRQWVLGKTTVGVTAGASAPEILVEQVIAKLKEWGGTIVTEGPGFHEKIIFSLPRELARAAVAIASGRNPIASARQACSGRAGSAVAFTEFPQH